MPLRGEKTFLVTRAKGIYKPRWTRYALSVRETLGGPYPGRPPTLRPDGTWRYLYYQENRDAGACDREYTNRALLLCRVDRVPVGVLIQSQRKPRVMYKVLGLALVNDWQEGFFTLEGLQEEAAPPRDSGRRS
jgi:putative restriction endonuclease